MLTCAVRPGASRVPCVGWGPSPAERPLVLRQPVSLTSYWMLPSCTRSARVSTHKLQLLSNRAQTCALHAAWIGQCARPVEHEQGACADEEQLAQQGLQTCSVQEGAARTK